MLVADTGTAATTYTDNTVAAETRYTYRIKAINGAGTSERSRWSHIDTPAAPVPDKPTGLEATESDGQVVLTWDDPGDDTITGYVILRRVRENNTGGDFSVLVADTGTAALTYTDDTVAASITYTYRIKAINEHGTSERSRWSHVDTPATPEPEEEQAAEPPDQPRGLEATATHDSVTLTWDDPNDDTITGYVVLRRIPGVDPKNHFNELVSDTGTDATTYTDDTVSAETRYTYRIKAINEHGVSERSRWSHIDVPAAPRVPPRQTRDNVSEPGGEDFPEDECPCGEVEIGGVVTGYAGGEFTDRDWFLVVFQAGVKYQIDLEGKATKRGSLERPTLLLTDEVGGSAISGGDGRQQGIQRNPRIVKEFSGTGPRTRYLRASRNNTGGPGTYTLSVIVLGDGKSEGVASASTVDDDFPASKSTPGRVSVGASATGWINSSSGERDAFRVYLQGGKRYQIDVEGEETGRGSLDHVKMELLSGDYRTEVARDYSSGNSSVTVSPKSGRYFVEVRGDKKGSYTVSVRDITPLAPPDLPSNKSTTGTVNVDGKVRGIISEPVFTNGKIGIDRDWFAVDMEAGKTYRIDMKGAILDGYLYTDPELTLLLPQINSIHDRLGGQLVNLWGHDESPAHHLFRVTFHAHRTETHYIAVSGEGRNWGGYELRVKDVTQDD